MKQITIDCRSIPDREAFHRVLARELDLPQWYGRNLDALHDLLTALSEEISLTFSGWTQAEETLGRYALMARKAISHAAATNPKFTVEFQ